MIQALSQNPVLSLEHQVILIRKFYIFRILLYGRVENYGIKCRIDLDIVYNSEIPYVHYIYLLPPHPLKFQSTQKIKVDNKTPNITVT
jgi:hypothetical protein